jgi:hypothetical protein
MWSIKGILRNLQKREVIMAELKGANRFDYEVVKLLRLINVDDLMLQTLDVALRATLEAEDDPDFPSEKFIEKFQQKVDMESLLYSMVPSYSKYYTREEIAGLIAFYETPLGRKSISEIPQITQEAIAASQTWSEVLVEKIVEDMDSLS